MNKYHRQSIAATFRDIDRRLAEIEAIIARHGLVELRPMLGKILAKMENPSLEAAFFGRVNSGKSSLLNYLLGEQVLPVGILPVTALLTRLVRAEKAEIVVKFEVSTPQSLPVDRIAEFVTEEGNPDNDRYVVEVEVRLPNPRLAEGVVFIDTPGVGSLATFGAAIPVMVLISKCDLLDAADRNRVREYVNQNIWKESGQQVPIYLVSSRETDCALTDRWFTEAILPRIQTHQELVRQSVRRKITHLEEMTISYLETMMTRLPDVPISKEASHRAPKTEAILRHAADRIAAAMDSKTQPLEAGLPEKIGEIIDRAAKINLQTDRRGSPRLNGLATETLRALAESAEEARLKLEELKQSLGQALEKISAACGLQDKPTSEEMFSALTPMPQADEGLLAGIPEVRYPRLLSWWPAQSLRAVRRRMERQGYQAISQALRDHRRRLQSWFKENLDSVCQTYESYVALYRDQLRCVDGAGQVLETAEQIHADLAVIRKLLPPVRHSEPNKAMKDEAQGGL